MAEHEKLIAEEALDAIDKQTMDEKRRAGYDSHPDDEWCVTLTAKHWRAIEAALSTQPEGRAGESDSAPPVSSPGPTVERAKYASPVTRLVCCGNQGCFEDKGCETARWWTERMDAAGYRLTRKPHVVKPEESHE